MNKLLTIVVPTYNMEAYLNRCLDSLIVSDEQLALFEVLVINDGSKDNSSKIAHEYESRYPNTFRVIDKENGNYGSCVNRGLQEAQGKYIKVLDADDWFDTSEFKNYLYHITAIDADLILTDFSIVDAERMEASLAYHASLKCGEIYLLQNSTIEQIGVYMMHAVTYRTELLRSINYIQTTGISYTDTEWVYNPLYAIKTLAYINDNVYQYLIGREGQTMDAKVMIKTIRHHEIVAKSLIENDLKHPTHGFTHKTIQRQIIYLLQKVYRTRLVLQDNESFSQHEMRQFDNYVKGSRPDMHKRMSKLYLKSILPIPYVLFWRLFGFRFPVDFIRKTYRRIKYGK